MVTRRSPLAVVLCALTLLGAPLVGCDPGTTEDETGVLLTISGEYAVPDEIDRLVLQIFDIAEDGSHAPLTTEVFDLAALGASLPATLAIVETRVPPAQKLGFRLDAFGGEGVLPVAWTEWVETDVPGGSHAEVPLALFDYAGLFRAGAGATSVCRGITAITSADFDEDGATDAAVLCHGGGTQRTLRALLGDGNGGLTASGWQAGNGDWPVACGSCEYTAIAATPRRAAASSDLLAGAETATSLSRFAGSGTGQFTKPGEAIGSAVYPIDLLVADADGDNNADLLWLNLVGPENNRLGILFGDSNGIQAGGEQVSVNTAARPRVAAAADFDGDRDLDVFVVSKETGQAPVGVLVRNDGSRSFTAGAEIGVGALAGDAAPAVAAGDFDGDGTLDLAVAVQDETAPRDGHNGYAILWGKGNGSFEDAVFFAAGHENLALAAADFNLDGIDDLALADHRDDLNDAWAEWDGVALFLGKGDRSFELLDVAGASLDHPRSLWVADFNGDSHPDLAVGMAALNPTGDEAVQVLIARP